MSVEMNCGITSDLHIYDVIEMQNRSRSTRINENHVPIHIEPRASPSCIVCGDSLARDALTQRIFSLFSLNDGDFLLLSRDPYTGDALKHASLSTRYPW